MIELSAGGYRAWILPERGGSCVRLERFGVQSFRTPKEPCDYRKSSFLWGTPPLFPPNRISRGCFQFEDRQYRFPVNEPSTGCFLHGDLHRTVLNTAERSPSFVRLSRAFTGDNPYLTFPHCFTFQIEYALGENGLHQKASLRNDSQLDMPAALAFHTTFQLPLTPAGKNENIRLSLDTEEEYGRDGNTYLPDGTACREHPLRHALESGTLIPAEHTISRLYRMGNLRTMTLTDLSEKVCVRYHAGDSYRYWMVYNGGDPRYICVEPQSWLSNCPNAPFPRGESGFDFLKPGETRSYETRTQIERIGTG